MQPDAKQQTRMTGSVLPGSPEELLADSGPPPRERFAALREVYERRELNVPAANVRVLRSYYLGWITRR